LATAIQPSKSEVLTSKSILDSVKISTESHKFSAGKSSKKYPYTYRLLQLRSTPENTKMWLKFYWLLIGRFRPWRACRSIATK